jgi:hypothetical protein
LHEHVSSQTQESENALTSFICQFFHSIQLDELFFRVQ